MQSTFSFPCRAAEGDEGASAAAAIDLDRIGASLDMRGYVVTGPLLDAVQCSALVALYDQDDAFRSRVVMQRHAFGRGEYKYFAYPLPPVVESLRHALYQSLVPIANRWRAALKEDGRFPPTLQAYLRQCHAAGQRRPTPLLLKYEADDYNCLHQDLYGPFIFPLQLTILLSAPSEDFEGGEFMIVEQRPRAQSKGEVVPLRQGEAVIFAVHHRPVQGARGIYRVNLRHGVSCVRRGRRFTLGLIFHDAA